MLLLVAGCPFFPSIPFGDAEVALERVAGGFTAPLALAAPDDGSGRLLVVSQEGLIHVVEADGTVREAPFLDIRERVVALDPFYDERGLLGIALHPDYTENGRFFVYYTAPPGPQTPEGFDSQNLVSEFRVSADDANVADPGSERVILAVGQPSPNHNGGQLAFGPDGYLYISKGDGGGVGDSGFGHNPQTGNAQDLGSLLGKILRIDVDGIEPYAIPPGNPFIGRAGARPEIWAYGLRNPWRFSFDRTPGGEVRLLAGDVGQFRVEEVNRIERGGNYGWRIREGSECFNVSNALSPLGSCPDTAADGAPLIPPILEYSHEDGTSVIGGYVYRGSAIPALQGRYVFGDYSRGFLTADGRIFAARETAEGAWEFDQVRVVNRPRGNVGRYLYAFGRDAAGELYVLTNDAATTQGTGGELYRLTAP